jgi:hypothetical protein
VQLFLLLQWQAESADLMLMGLLLVISTPTLTLLHKVLEVDFFFFSPPLHVSLPSTSGVRT